MGASSRVVPGVPVWTLLIGGAAAIVFLVPALQDALIYDRVAISQGEWWRLTTGHLVHYSTAHFAYDALAFLVAGSIAELRRCPLFGPLCLISALAIGAVLYFATPEMSYYAGLSGVATAAFAYVCLSGLTEARPWRGLCLAVLAILTVKIALELIFRNSLTAYAARQPFIPIPLSHAVGAATALLLFLSTWGVGVFRAENRLQNRGATRRNGHRRGPARILQVLGRADGE